MVKEKRILSYFLGWLIVGFCIIFVGVNNVLAEEVAYSNATFRVKECGSSEWSNWTSATQKLSVYSINNLGFRLYFSNTQLTGNTYYNITVTYNFYTETPSINVMNAYGKSTFYYNTTASESGNIQGNNNNYSVRFEKDTENTNLIKAVYNVLVPVNAKFIAFNINWDEPNKDTCRTLSDGFTISNIKIESLNDTQAIVDGNNANTENIINNNNQNTQDIINNQNSNTDKEIESQKVCSKYDKSNIKEENLYFLPTGVKVTDSGFGITDYINIDNATLKFNTYNYTWSASSCFYDINKTLINCKQNQQLTNDIIPSNAVYIKLSVAKSENKPTLEVCKNGNQAINDGLNDLNDTLTDSSPTDMSGLGDSAGWLPAGPVDSILTLPLTMLNNLVNNLSSGSCQKVVLKLPYVEKNIDLPCIKTLYEKMGITGTLFQSAGLIASAFILFNYLLKLYQWVDATLTMRENTMPGYFDDNWGGGA